MDKSHIHMTNHSSFLKNSKGSIVFYHVLLNVSGKPKSKMSLVVRFLLTALPAAPGHLGGCHSSHLTKAKTFVSQDTKRKALVQDLEKQGFQTRVAMTSRSQHAGRYSSSPFMNVNTCPRTEPALHRTSPEESCTVSLEATVDT